jgi:hypothetical protein
MLVELIVRVEWARWVQIKLQYHHILPFAYFAPESLGIKRGTTLIQWG